MSELREETPLPRDREPLARELEPLAREVEPPLRELERSSRDVESLGLANAPASLPPTAERTRTFARGLWRIAAADVSADNRVQLLADGATTFDAMIAAIGEASTRVDFEGYIFRDDEVGVRFKEALIEAAMRGVQVRLLVDWVGRMGTPLRFFGEMAKHGVVVKLFSPPGFHRWGGILPRDHRKLVVADGAVAVTGGIGIGREWKHGVLRRKRSPWRDTAVRIAGPAAVDMQDSFERMWARAHQGRPKGVRLIRRPSASHLDPQVDPPSLVGIVEGEPGRMRASRGLQMQALNAERTIWIASAYFAPSLGMVEALAGAARDGVDVRILVPSRYDHPWLRTIISPFYSRLFKHGVRIWEWRGEMMHAKTNVVDGRWVRVGSTDFNLLGVAINYELDAVIEDATLGEQAEAMFLEDLHRAREIRWRSTRTV
ncbi:MAG: phosphatidylserine/phosphatidylglycerophosphate/cardiolipin synthase family protein [Gemmatimonadaceae bacterium]|nr:phosphatidylserine/phosphatidylglycerophosphate/cardiolipin synthase family protein [Gemmatimonadaceae bacterium]